MGNSGTLCTQKALSSYKADKNAMGDAAKWLKENSNEECTITLFNGVPLSVAAPNFVELVITETDPGLKGDTSGGGGKPATLETGAVVMCHYLSNKAKKSKSIPALVNIYHGYNNIFYYQILK